MKKFILCAAVSLSSLCFSSNNQQTVLYDAKYTPYMGAEDLLTAHHALIRLEDVLLEAPGSTRKPILAPLGRFLELALFWNPLNQFSVAFQHEVFGHGYRIRDLGKNIAKIKEYQFNIPYPYSPGGAATHFLFYPPKLTSQLASAVSTGGIDATYILANRMVLRWIASNEMDGRESSLYQSAWHDSTWYILSLSTKEEECITGHDIEDYLFNLSLTYPDSKISKRALKKRTLINFIDPFTFYSIWSNVKYIISGSPSSIPMIPFGKVGYLPALRFGLTPFGPEYTMNHYFRHNNAPIYAYTRYGEYASNRYYGIGIEYPKMVQTSTLSFGFRLDAWRQPKILFEPGEDKICGISYGYAPSQLSKTQYGMAYSVIMQQDIFKSLLTTYEQIGWKTEGYLPGESLKAGPIARVGIQGRF